MIFNGYVSLPEGTCYFTLLLLFESTCLLVNSCSLVKSSWSFFLAEIHVFLVSVAICSSYAHLTCKLQQKAVSMIQTTWNSSQFQATPICFCGSSTAKTPNDVPGLQSSLQSAGVRARLSQLGIWVFGLNTSRLGRQPGMDSPKPELCTDVQRVLLIYLNIHIPIYIYTIYIIIILYT